MRASGCFFQYIREPEGGYINIHGSRRLVLSIDTGAGGWFFQYIREPEVGSFDIYGNRRVVFRYIRDPEVGSINIYGSRKLGISIYTAAGSWVFQHIR